MGFCIKLGPEHAESGKAKATKVDNTSTLAKIAWYIYENKLTNSSKTCLGDSYYQENHLAMNLLQICNQGKSSFKTEALADNMPSSFVEKIFDEYDRITALNITVPDNFEVFRCTVNGQSNVQPFVLYRYNPQGKFKLKKSSSNTMIIS